MLDDEECIKENREKSESGLDGIAFDRRPVVDERTVNEQLCAVSKITCSTSTYEGAKDYHR